MNVDPYAVESAFSLLTDPIRVPGGDVPGADVQVGPDRLVKAKLILPLLLDKLSAAKTLQPSGRVVVSVAGGSGVGKSGIAALLTYALNRLGIGTYLLSGDNYPHRVPPVNDAERVRRFREAGYKALVGRDGYGRTRRSRRYGRGTRTPTRRSSRNIHGSRSIRRPAPTACAVISEPRRRSISPRSTKS